MCLRSSDTSVAVGELVSFSTFVNGAAAVPQWAQTAAKNRAPPRTWKGHHRLNRPAWQALSSSRYWYRCLRRWAVWCYHCESMPVLRASLRSLTTACLKSPLERTTNGETRRPATYPTLVSNETESVLLLI